MPIVARLAGPAPSRRPRSGDGRVGRWCLAARGSPPVGRARPVSRPVQAPHRSACAGCPLASCALSATILATPALGGSRRSRGRSTSSAASSAPIRSRRGLAASFDREAFRPRESSGPREPARRFEPVRIAYALRWLELGDGVLRAGMDKSRHRPRLTRPRSRRPLSFADAPVTPLLHHPPRRPRRRRDAVASTARPRGLRPPARFRDLLAAAARQAGQRPRRAGHPRGAERGSAARRSRCRSSTRPTSGGRAAATTRSGPS